MKMLFLVEMMWKRTSLMLSITHIRLALTCAGLS